MRRKHPRHSRVASASAPRPLLGQAPRPRVAFVETTELSIRSHLHGLARRMQAAGNDVVLVAADQGGLGAFAREEGVSAVPVELRRAPSPLADLKSLIRLTRVLSSERLDIVVYGTPKAALIAALSSSFLRIPRRIYVIHGLRLETMGGIARRAMALVERAIIFMSTDVIAVGHGLRARLCEQLGVKDRHIQVLGAGSASGVDTDHFSPAIRDHRLAARRSLNLGHVDFVYLFIGRISRDKGIHDLLQAFLSIDSMAPRSQLVLAGDIELPPSDRDDFVERVQESARLSWIPYQTDIQMLLSIANCLVLPTHREGLPNVLLEAGAAEVPIISTFATGVADIIDNGRTGLLVPVGNPSGLAAAMLAVLREPEVASARASLLRVEILEKYRQEQVWDNWVKALTVLPELSRRTVWE